MELPLPLLAITPMDGLNYNSAMQQIIPGVFMHSNASIYQYLIVENGQITLIDTGLHIFSRSLIRTITNMDHQAALSLILITHADGDHYGSAKQLSETYRCPIAASAPKDVHLGGVFPLSMGSAFIATTKNTIHPRGIFFSQNRALRYAIFDAGKTP